MMSKQAVEVVSPAPHTTAGQISWRLAWRAMKDSYKDERIVEELDVHIHVWDLNHKYIIYHINQ